MSQTNRLIDVLRPAAQERLLAAARLVEFRQGTILTHPNEPISSVYFLTAGLGSFVVALEDGGSAEIGVIGREGMVGSVGLLGTYAPLARCIMQTDGQGYRVSIGDARRLFEESAEIRQRMLQSTQQQMLTLSQMAACNRLHHAPERLARWLLTASDYLESSTVSLTQETLAQMLGTRRTTVALTAGELQRAGLIQYGRARVTIVNREGLRDAACDCYKITRDLIRKLYQDEPASQ